MPLEMSGRFHWLAELCLAKYFLLSKIYVLFHLMPYKAFARGGYRHFMQKLDLQKTRPPKILLNQSIV